MQQAPAAPLAAAGGVGNAPQLAAGVGQPIPPAAVPPPLGVGLNPQPTTYRELYQRPESDAYRGNYVNLYNSYAVGNGGPAEVRNALYQDGNDGVTVHL